MTKSSIEEQKSYQHTTNYAIFGLAFGFAFPVVATLFEINLDDLAFSIQSASKVQIDNPLLWIIDTAPFVLGTLAAFAGYLKDQTVHLNKDLEKKVEERTIKLEKKNELLNQEIEQRKKTEKELIKAKEAAEAAAKAKTQFLSTMSHEIRTPLNAVIGMSGLLEDTALNLEQKDFVQTINKSGENLLAIINNILDYAKIESGMFELEELEFSIAHLIEDVLDLVSATEIDHQIELVYLIESNVPEYVFGDTTRIQQVLVNLVRNALKFTEAGEIMIYVKSIKSLKDSSQIQFEVRDTGIGIPIEKKERLFKSFSQVDASTTRKFGGTGLGLAICKRLVELMNGKITVESSVGIGSTFSFNIKLGKSVRKYEVLQTVNLQDKKIFILDDNDTNLLILKAQCVKAGMSVTTFSDPYEVVNSMSKLKEFDLGILDMQMPGKNGTQVAKEIRNTYSKEQLPLVLLSSIMDLGGKEERNRFNLYLTKPVKQTHLLHNLERLFGDLSGTFRSTEKEKSNNLQIDKKIKILLAEDNVINQKVAKKMLERLGQTCDIAANGIEAVQMCSLISYDVVLMDMEMPEMDGLEATKQLLSKGNLIKKLPIIIAMTANAMEEDKNRCLEAGMNDFLSKPVKLSDMHEILVKWFLEENWLHTKK